MGPRKRLSSAGTPGRQASGYQHDMNTPKLCPICGVEQVEPMFLNCTVQPLFDGEVHPLGGSLRVFWCANSHVFMLLDCGSLKVAAPVSTENQRPCRGVRRYGPFRPLRSQPVSVHESP